MKNIKNIIGILTLIAGTAIESKAQTNASSAASQSVQLGLANAIELTFPNGNATQTATINSIIDLLTGVDLPDTEVKVRSNKAFKVEVATATNDFNYIGSALIAPILSANAALRVKVSDNKTGGNTASASWLFLNTLGTAPVTILNNCDPGNNQTFSIRYKMIPGVTLPSGTYTIDMVLTATQL